MHISSIEKHADTSEKYHQQIAIFMTTNNSKHKRDRIDEEVKKYAHRYLSYLPISYVLAKRVEYIKDTFG
jgi:hypothetical protein